MSEKKSESEPQSVFSGGEITPEELELDEQKVAELRRRVAEIEASYIADAGQTADEGRCSFRDVTLNLLSAAGPDVRFLEDTEERDEEPEEVPLEERDLRNCLELLEMYLTTVTKYPDVLAKEMTEDGAYPDLRVESDGLATQHKADSIDHYVRAMADRIAEGEKARAREEIDRLGS